MKTTYFVLSISMLLLSIYSNAQDQFQLEGYLDGFPDSTRIIINRKGADFRILETEVTLYLKNNRFSFSEKLVRPSFFSLRIRPKLNEGDNSNFTEYEEMSFWAENKPMSLTGSKGKIVFADVKGSVIQDQFEAFVGLEKERKLQVKSTGDSLRMFMAILPDSLKKTMINGFRENMELIRKKSIEFILTHPEYYFARNELIQLHWSSADQISLTDLRSFYEQLTTGFKNDAYGKQLGELIKTNKTKKALAVGDKALPFQLRDSAENMVSLSSLSGKLVLVDFWGSGCGPCRAEHQNYSSLYKTYQAKGFEILSISMDSRKDLWRKAMQADKMIWLSVWDREFVVYDSYKVEGIPTNYLIDKNGVIIGKDLRGKELADWLEGTLGK